MVNIFDILEEYLRSNGWQPDGDDPKIWMIENKYAGSFWYAVQVQLKLDGIENG